MYKYYLREFILAVSPFRKIYINNLINKGVLVSPNSDYLEVADKVTLDRPLSQTIKVGLVKELDEFEKDGYIELRAYWDKYQRFLKNNNISYDIYDVNAPDWIEQARQYDVIVWRTGSEAAKQEVAKDKIYVLEKLMGKHCLPSYDELWSYENKVNAHYHFKVNNLPEIPTFVTTAKQHALNYIRTVKLPVIAKIATGSASKGVQKIDTVKEGEKLINKAFGYKGLKTYFPYKFQKDYVYFQEFVDGADFDLRIIVIEDKFLGYYRKPKSGDYKASGSGIYEKKAIPPEAMELAKKAADCLGANCLATDLLFDKSTNQYLIIESSIFIAVDTAEQLSIDGVPGYYQRNGELDYEFKTGKFWIQELTLKSFLQKIY